VPDVRYAPRMSISRALAVAAVLLLRAPSFAVAADLVSAWTPGAWKSQDTLELQTTVPEEGEYWFPVWLVVLDEQVYVRLGTRAADRVEKSTTKPYMGVRIAGQQFDRMKGTPAPEMADKVAAAMGQKYWSDVFIKYFNHPLTLRLTPEAAQ
jgi:hypothetical protein